MWHQPRGSSFRYAVISCVASTTWLEFSLCYYMCPHTTYCRGSSVSDDPSHFLLHFEHVCEHAVDSSVSSTTWLAWIFPFSRSLSFSTAFGYGVGNTPMRRSLFLFFIFFRLPERDLRTANACKETSACGNGGGNTPTRRSSVVSMRAGFASVSGG